MNIYALKDRLIGYFMQPFCGPDDKNVLAAVARTVNQQENMSDIAQAPHHFEIWRLGEVQEDGHITSRPELVATCDSLIRAGIRQGPTTTRHQSLGPDQDARQDPPQPGRDGSPRGTHNRALQGATPPTEGTANEVRRGPQGGYPPRDN